MALKRVGDMTSDPEVLEYFARKCHEEASSQWKRLREDEHARFQVLSSRWT
jgi:hypothetical protein